MAALGSVAERRDILSRGLWAEGYGSLGRRRGNDISSRYDSDMAGFAAGFDRQIGSSFLLGASLGYSHTKVDMKDLSDDATKSSYQGSLYGIYRMNPFYLSAIAAYGYNRYDTTRDISFGTISRRAKASYAGQTLGGYLEGGVRIATPPVDHHPPRIPLRASPSCGTASPRGTPGLSVSCRLRHHLLAHVLPGVGSRRTTGYRQAPSPRVRMTWDHDFANDDYALDASFAGYPLTTFTARGDRPHRDSLGASLSLAFEARRTSPSTSPTAAASPGTHAARGTVGLRWRVVRNCGRAARAAFCCYFSISVIVSEGRRTIHILRNARFFRTRRRDYEVFFMGYAITSMSRSRRLRGGPASGPI
jgi:hypothetical protein